MSLQTKQKKRNKKKKKNNNKSKEKKNDNTLMLSFCGLDPKLINLEDWIQTSDLKYGWDMAQKQKINLETIAMIKKLYRNLREKGSKFKQKIPTISELVNYGVLIECVPYSTNVKQTIKKIGGFFKNENNDNNNNNNNNRICILFKLKRYGEKTPQYFFLKRYYSWCQKQCDTFCYNDNYFIFVFLNEKFGF